MNTIRTTRRAMLAGGLGGMLAARSAWAQSARQADPRLPPGLVGEFHSGGAGRRPAMLVLGGSEGGLGTGAKGARLLAAEGYASLGLAYFKAPGLPDTLEHSPLEYFIRAVDWLARQPSVDPRRIGVLGGSKGAEAALLLAAYEPRLKAVVACAPSSVVWPGVDMANQAHMATIGSSWSWKGAPLPYARYDFTGFRGIRAMYERSYVEAPPESLIPVERIKGDVLLISGGKDELWPSAPMSEAIMARLDQARFRGRRLHLNYPDGGHGIFGPPATPDPRLPPPPPGGQWAMTMEARADSWPKVLAFLETSLKGKG